MNPKIEMSILVVLLVATIALGLAVARGGEAPARLVVGQSMDADRAADAQAMAGAWIAAGVCAPSVVTPQVIRMAFDPALVAPPPEGQEWPEIEVGDDYVRFGDYMVKLDMAAHSVTVTGPEGADLLERDIRSCVEDLPLGDSIGRWEGSRYVDAPLGGNSGGEENA